MPWNLWVVAAREHPASRLLVYIEHINKFTLYKEFTLGKVLSCLLSKDHSQVSFSPIFYLPVDFADIKPHPIYHI